MAHKIVKYLNNNQNVMLDLLKELVSIETPSKNKEAQHIFLNLIEKLLCDLGYYTFSVKGNTTGGFLYARPKKKKSYSSFQLLLGHCDTVWEINTINELPVTQENNRITGPGIFDMKAGIVQILFALKTIKELALKSEVMPLILINSDEEIGSGESSHAIKRLSKIVCRSFIMEPPMGLDGKLKTARKGVGRFSLTVKGKAAHAGLDPEKGINAIVELSSLVQQLYNMNDFERGISINVGMIEGGNSPNIIPAESRAVIDVRVHSVEDGAYITDRIYNLKPLHEDVILIIEGGIGRPPMEKTSRNQNLWKKAQKNGALIGLTLSQATAGGGSDGNTTSLYTATLDGLGTTGDGAHARHEYIFKDKLVERTALLTLMVLEDA